MCADELHHNLGHAGEVRHTRGNLHLQDLGLDNNLKGPSSSFQNSREILYPHIVLETKQFAVRSEAVGSTAEVLYFQIKCFMKRSCEICYL